MSWKKQLVNVELPKGRGEFVKRPEWAEPSKFCWQDSLTPARKVNISGDQSMVTAAIETIQLFLLIL